MVMCNVIDSKGNDCKVFVKFLKRKSIDKRVQSDNKRIKATTLQHLKTVSIIEITKKEQLLIVDLWQIRYAKQGQRIAFNPSPYMYV